MAQTTPAQHVFFGVYKVAPAECTAVTLSALHAGFRHIDTAQVYGNERETGAAIQSFLSAHPQERIFLTTTVWRLAPGAAPLAPGQAHARGAASSAASQAALGLPIDLLLLHAPGAPGAARQEAWRAMEEAVRGGNWEASTSASALLPTAQLQQQQQQQQQAQARATGRGHSGGGWVPATMTLIGPSSFTQSFLPAASAASASAAPAPAATLSAAQGRSLSNILGEIEAAVATLLVSPQRR